MNSDIELMITVFVAGTLTAAMMMSMMLVKYDIDNVRTDPTPPAKTLTKYFVTCLTAAMVAVLWVKVVQQLILYAVSAANIIEKLNDPSIHALKDMTI